MNALTVPLVVMSITGLEALALILGHNGAILLLSFSLLAGIGGYRVKGSSGIKALGVLARELRKWRSSKG